MPPVVVETRFTGAPNVVGLDEGVMSWKVTVPLGAVVEAAPVTVAVSVEPLLNGVLGAVIVTFGTAAPVTVRVQLADVIEL
jgi:hypothetical protein